MSNKFGVGRRPLSPNQPDGGTTFCPPETITLQPVSRTVTAGQSTQFIVGVSQRGIERGCAPRIQWEFKTSATSQFTPVPFANSTQLDFQITTPQMAGIYRARVSVDFLSVYSNEVVLTVNGAPPVSVSELIAEQPNATTCNALGGSATFFVVPVVGKTLTYQWEFMGAGTNTFTAISGATTATYTVTNCSTANAGFYRVKVREGTKLEISGQTFLSVPLSNPLRISTQPVKTLTPALGATFKISVAAQGGTAPILYRWQRRLSDLTYFRDLPGQNTPTLSIVGFNPSRDAGTYRVHITDSSSSKEIYSDETVVSLKPSDSIKSEPPTAILPIASRSAAQGTTVSVTPRLQGATPFTYKWFYKGAELTGITTATLSRSLSASTEGAYQLQASNANGTLAQNFEMVIRPSVLKYTLTLNGTSVSANTQTPSQLNFGTATPCGILPNVGTLEVTNFSDRVLGYDVVIPAGVALFTPDSGVKISGSTTVQLSVPSGQTRSILLALDLKSTAALTATSKITINIAGGGETRTIQVSGANALLSPSPSPSPTPCVID
jgi:hypothetical protein